MSPVGSFDDFLSFENTVFRSDFPIARYDPYLVRYGEYRFLLDVLPFERQDTVLDLGCEANIFMLYLAYLGLDVIGVDLDASVWTDLRPKVQLVEQATNRQLKLAFRHEDATWLSLPPGSVDKVIAVSSIEHMFSDCGDGDALAIESIARVLKPGGLAALTLPMSDGEAFHEAPRGDARFAAPYRLYTPEALSERILSSPELKTVRVAYLAHATPIPGHSHVDFFRFWMDSLTNEDRLKWAWVNPILAATFNPIISECEGQSRLESLNTALICLKKSVHAGD